MSRIHSQTEGRRYFIGGSNARVIIGQGESALLCLCREKRGEVEPEHLSGKLIVQLGLATVDKNRPWYERITGRMPVGRYLVALCYATAVILVGWWPWNILLILPVLPSRNPSPLRFRVFVAPESSMSVRSKAFCERGGSL